MTAKAKGRMSWGPSAGFRANGNIPTTVVKKVTRIGRTRNRVTSSTAASLWTTPTRCHSSMYSTRRMPLFIKISANGKAAPFSHGTVYLEASKNAIRETRGHILCFLPNCTIFPKDLKLQPLEMVASTLMRAFGVLLPITALPGGAVLGDLGPWAHRFVEWLQQAGASYWQVLPVGPLGPGNSPYAAPSTFAGNPLLISPEFLVEDGLLPGEALNREAPSSRFVLYEQLPKRWQMLAEAFSHFEATRWREDEFLAFCSQEASWLEDWAVFATAQAVYGNPFWHWPAELLFRNPKALANFCASYARELEKARFYQFLFHLHWQKLRQRLGPVKLLGDLPFFVAASSADVWSHPQLFKLDPQLRPKVVAGVPPDYFSRQGQFWGNPVYNWEAHEATGFAWWRARLERVLKLFDVVRLDHFRGFAAAWEVPANAPNASEGNWVRGPGLALFQALGENLPLVAEDLGFITPDVVELRDKLGVPGMAILQFAFNPEEKSSFLPHNHRENLVVYTGTHDNNTALGWWEEETTPQQRAFFRAYTGSEEPAHLALIRLAMASVARLAIIPMQDVLGLPSSCRTNRPGTGEGNWRFRLLPQELTSEAAAFLHSLADIYQRL